MSFSKNFNLGGYETQRIGLEIEEVSKDSLDKTFLWLVEKVHKLNNKAIKLSKEDVDKKYNVKEIKK